MKVGRSRIVGEAEESKGAEYDWQGKALTPINLAGIGNSKLE